MNSDIYSVKLTMYVKVEKSNLPINCLFVYNLQVNGFLP